MAITLLRLTFIVPNPRMPRPPESVVFVARTHWLVGGVVVASTGLLHLVLRDVPVVHFGLRTYAITGALGLSYLLAGALVWLGWPFGPLLSRVCTLLYLPRPGMGLRVWETMNSPEFKAHFKRASAPGA